MPAGTILICDDDSAIRTVLNQALGRAGYDVRTTGTAARAPKLMPEINDWALCAEPPHALTWKSFEGPSSVECRAVRAARLLLNLECAAEWPQRAVALQRGRKADSR